MSILSFWIFVQKKKKSLNKNLIYFKEITLTCQCELIQVSTLLHDPIVFAVYVATCKLAESFFLS